MTTPSFLQSDDCRSNLMRFDTAIILKRFHYCERQIAIAEAGWISGTAPLLLKLLYAEMMWEDSQAADAMRTRVFELRYPSRMMEKGGEEPLIALLSEMRHAPNALAFYLILIELLKPALLDAYRRYLELADTIGDGPSVRFMQAALRDKESQIAKLNMFRDEMTKVSEYEKTSAFAWLYEAGKRLKEIGGINLNEPETKLPFTVSIKGKKTFSVPQVPIREKAYANVRFYWPDIIVKDFPYGEGLNLQLRSAVSHINEVWAVETCSHFSYSFAELLPWEFFVDASRWTFDEARHCRMGYERLLSWGFEKHEIPVGTYITDAAKNQDPIYRLGMLYFFETKNIKHKPKRREEFMEIGDMLSSHDMDFDWADETMHAAYGKTWLTAIQEGRDEGNNPNLIRARCHDLVDEIIQTATDEERVEILELAKNMVAKARKIIADKGSLCHESN